MPLDEEQPDFALEISSEANRTIQGKLMSSGVAGVLSLVPGVGGAITELLTELAIQRANNRMREMFTYFTSKIRDIGEEKVDREWFRSEEFQTLLFEALQQLHITHDQEKIKMLGVALANSGTSQFREDERKVLFIRFVRELTRLHLKLLIELASDSREFVAKSESPYFYGDPLMKELYDHNPHWRVRNDNLLAIRILQANGLVVESSSSDTTSFRITALGQDFLDFTELSHSVHDERKCD